MAEVRLRDRDKLLLGCIYCSPNTDEENNNKLLEMLETVQQLRPTNLLLVGDFNCKINWDTLVAEQGEKNICRLSRINKYTRVDSTHILEKAKDPACWI